MRILSISAQKPDSTGSGVYMTELIRAFADKGYEQGAVAGIGGGGPAPRGAGRGVFWGGVF